MEELFYQRGTGSRRIACDNGRTLFSHNTLQKEKKVLPLKEKFFHFCSLKQISFFHV